MQPDLIITPFGESADPGTIRPIPESTGPSDPKQNASWEKGFPSPTMIPISSGGVPPEGPDMNGVLNAISKHTAFIGGGGQYRWSDEYSAAKGGYSKGAVLQSDNGDASYVSAIDNNTTNFNTIPGSIGSQWIFYCGPDGFYRSEFDAAQDSREEQFKEWLAGTSFELPAIPYVDGTPLVIARPTQLIVQGGQLYSVKADKAFPYTLTGTWATDLPSLAPREDLTLRQELAAPSGANKVGFEDRTISARLSEKISLADVGAVSGAAANGAIAAAMGKGVPIIVPAGVFRVTASVTITAPSIEFLAGGSFSLDTGVVLTIDAPLIAGGTQLFSGNGQVLFTRNAKLRFAHIEWWGAKADGATDSLPGTNEFIRAVGLSSIALSTLQYLSGQYVYGGPVILPAGGICFRGVRPVDTYLTAASAGATRISSIGTWTGFLFDAPNNSVVKGGLRFQDFFIGVSTKQRQGIWRLGTEVRSPMFSNIGAVGAGLQILKSDAPITQIEGGYWNNGYILEVDIDGNPLTDWVGVVEISGADWCIDRAHIGHDTPASGNLGLVAALYTKVGAASGRCSNTVLEQSDVPLVCAANDGMFINTRVELAGKEAMIVSGNNNQFVNLKVGIAASSRDPGVYDAIKVSGGLNRFIGVNNDLTAGTVKDFIHDTRGLTSDSMNTYSGLPQGRPNVAKAYTTIAGLVLRADGICSLEPTQGISLYVNLETSNVINADNVMTIHGRRPLDPVTRIENGVPGQTITLMLNQGSTTYKHNAAGGNLWLLTKADTVVGTMTPTTFLKMSDGIWYQTR